MSFIDPRPETSVTAHLLALAAIAHLAYTYPNEAAAIIKALTDAAPKPKADADRKPEPRSPNFVQPLDGSEDDMECLRRRTASVQLAYETLKLADQRGGCLGIFGRRLKQHFNKGVAKVLKRDILWCKRTDATSIVFHSDPPVKSGSVAGGAA
jgi:hypothetical protein